MTATTGPTMSAYISRLVDEAPPLSPAQRARLAVLLAGSAQVLPSATSQRRPQPTQDEPAPSLRRRRRPTTAEHLEEVLRSRIAAAFARPLSATSHAAMVSAEERDAARAIAAKRRMDAERRRTHANDHFYCVSDECAVAASRDPYLIPDDRPVRAGG